jgi:hypothetical protein
LSDGNDTKTNAELLAEIAALKAQLAQRDDVVASKVGPTSKAAPADTTTAADKTTGAAAPVFAASMTRRQSIVSWVAPVILSLPVVQAIGAVIKPGTAHAATDDAAAPVVAPTRAGRCVIAPTAAPTAKPTRTPTAKPTAPTKKGAPTVSPTLGMASTPDSRPSADRFIALGEARALVRGDIGP